MPYNLKPETRHEAFLDKAAGNTHNLTPVTREEMFLDNIANAGGGGGTSDYSDLSNKPKINSTTLEGNLSSADLGLQSNTMTGYEEAQTATAIETTDTVLEAIGKLEKGEDDNKTNILSITDRIKFSANSKTYYLQPEQPSNPQDGDIWIG